MREMMVEQHDVFYYITLMNENYAQADLPEGVQADVIRGCYRFAHMPSNNADAKAVTLLGSGAILTEVIKAAHQLASQGFEVTVYSVTSWSELARDGLAWEQANIAGEKTATPPFITTQLIHSKGPVIAASDYVRAVPETIRAFVPEQLRYVTLGTDGFGRSDTRAALRAFFKVDAASIVQAAMYATRD
jgi:pyruvate dehydrogenase E1 component